MSAPGEATRRARATVGGSDSIPIYRAEREAWSSGWHETMTLDRAREYIAEVWRGGIVRDIIGGPIGTMPAVTDGRRRRSACGSPSRIALPRKFRNEPVILHEIAHALTPGARHTVAFVRVFRALCGAYLSPSEVARLDQALIKHGYVGARSVAPVSALTGHIRAQQRGGTGQITAVMVSR